MFAIFRNKGFWVLTFVIILLLIAAGVTREPGRQVTLVEDHLLRIVKPISSIFYKTGMSTSRMCKLPFEIKDLKDENQMLLRQIIELENQSVLIEELKLENDRLMRMLDFKIRSHQFDMEAARVIGRSPETWFNIIVIDKGKKNGIGVNMAVVTDRGLVARVDEVGESWAKARLIIDQRSAVSGMIQRTRANGVIKGGESSDGQGLCRMVYLPENSNVVAGDLVISSGLGGVFPKGLVIGRIVEVKEDQDGLLKYAVVKPAVDLERLEEVLIIKGSDTVESEVR